MRPRAEGVDGGGGAVQELALRVAEEDAVGACPWHSRRRGAGCPRRGVEEEEEQREVHLLASVRFHRLGQEHAAEAREGLHKRAEEKYPAHRGGAQRVMRGGTEAEDGRGAGIASSRARPAVFERGGALRGWTTAARSSSPRRARGIAGQRLRRRRRARAAKCAGRRTAQRPGARAGRRLPACRAGTRACARACAARSRGAAPCPPCLRAPCLPCLRARVMAAGMWRPFPNVFFWGEMRVKKKGAGNAF